MHYRKPQDSGEESTILSRRYLSGTMRRVCARVCLCVTQHSPVEHGLGSRKVVGAMPDDVTLVSLLLYWRDTLLALYLVVKWGPGGLV